MDPLSAIRVMTPDMRAMSAKLQEASAAISSSVPKADLRQLSPTTNLTATPELSSPGASFDDLLGKMVHEVNSKQVAAGDAVNRLISGQNGSLHEAVISMEEANVSFQLMVETRNKLLESYQELMRMQV